MKKKNKSTKKSLVMSAISLVLCVAMLMGTTFAWFTDNVTSGSNKIVAGNLDIEVSYEKTHGNWVSIQDETTLFNPDALWEPGHTEFVTLKVENKGTLALNYKMMVTPVSENGGVNVDGESFKLSDYLKFGITEATTTPLTYTRETARAAVTATATGLNQTGLTKTSTMTKESAPQYITLVVYMPEDVDNVANYKTGTAAPTINLGVTVLATQKTEENDSFGSDYDNGATVVSPYNVGPAYYYFPQVVESAPVAEGNNSTTIDAKGKLNSTDADDITLAKVTVPRVAVADNVGTLTLKVTPQDPSMNTANQSDLRLEIENQEREIANFDIKVDGIKEDNEELINVTVFVGTGLANVKLYHNGRQMTSGVTYVPTTGYVTFTTDSFSDYTVAYDAAVAAIGTKTYGSLANAVAAAQPDATITLLKDSSGNGIGLYANPKAGQTQTKNLIIDFNGFTYTIGGDLQGSTGYKSQAFHLEKDCNVTLMNGTLTSTNAQMLVQNYSNLTLENMVLDGTKSSTVMGYVVSNNNGNVVIKDTTINAAEGKVAFDVCRYSSYTGPVVTVEGNSVINGKVEISSSGAKEGAIHQLNVTGGTFNGEIYKAGESPNFVGTITGGTFTVGSEAALNTLLDSIAADASNVTINLASDISLAAPIQVSKNVTINGQNHTITSGNFDSFKVTGTVDFALKNLTIESQYKRYVDGVEATTQEGSKLSFENVTINNAEKAILFSGCAETAVSIKGCTLSSLYPFNVSGGTITSFTVEDSQLNGWTSFNKLANDGVFQFKNCSFGEKFGYATLKPYGDTTFEGCTISEEFFEGLESGIASGTETPITVNFNKCFVKASDGTTQALTIDLLKTAFNYDITSGSSSGDSTINDQYWYVNGVQIAFAPSAE